MKYAVCHVVRVNGIFYKEVIYKLFLFYRGMLNIPEEKYHFLGKEYGYTGNTCPILCLNRMWDKYAVTGNRIVISTAGAGLSYIVQLYEF